MQAVGLVVTGGSIIRTRCRRIIHPLLPSVIPAMALVAETLAFVTFGKLTLLGTIDPYTGAGPYFHTALTLASVASFGACSRRLVRATAQVC